MDAPELETRVGESIKRLRIDRRLTQQELADQANVSIGAVKSLEHAKGTTLTTMVKVLHVLRGDSWIDSLAPGTTFNPLSLLDSNRPGERRPSRVRHARPRT